MPHPSDISTSDHSAGRAQALAVARFARHVWRRVLADNVLGVAGSLSYTSLLALVPLLAIALSVLAAFPVFDRVRDQLRDFVVQNFLPSVGMAVDEKISVFVAAAGQLTAAGVVGLAVTAVLLLMTVEGVFNRIFRVARGRSLVARIVAYWTVLTLGPLLIGTSFAIASAVTATLTGSGGQAAGLWAKASVLVPYLLTLAAFLLLYLILPHRKVQVRDAALGAMVSAVLFAMLRFGFVIFITNVKTYQTLYGAVAAIPIFLVWMFLSWTVVLVGAVITAALPEWRLRQGTRGGDDRQERLVLALDLLATLSSAGPRGLTRTALLADVGVPENILAVALTRLRNADFVVQSASAQSVDAQSTGTPSTSERWVLVRDLERATLHDLIDALALALPEPPPAVAERCQHGRLADLLTEARAREADVLDVPLARIVEGAPPSP